MISAHHYHFNVFRILGDLSHTVSKCILIWAIHANRSAEGVSLITQILYAVVFCSRYLDLFWTKPSHMPWNFVLKLFYLGSSFYIILLMTRVYARTREREKAWKFGSFCLAGSTVAAPLVLLIFEKWHHYDFHLVMWTLSEILESVCVLPQLILLRQTSVPTVIDSFYLVTLGSYRAFYILNWFVRYFGAEHHFEPIATIFGTVQTALYLDFAWVYWSRQRVKLRNGGVVDSDDLNRGWLVSHLAPRNDTEEEEQAASLSEQGSREQGSTGGAVTWGPRGISVSADDDPTGEVRR
ncbi:MAG: hypothetical protein L6R38_000988 [Xanthoria sp. 2 TBL-2021]|nr:MAG: hypothetical protein L6R38_000988 [Xanthoria sp. 2 TBL-2021]